MKQSSRNRLANVKNPYQGTAPKVLCVCSAGLLRSPTLAKLLVTEYGCNTRACGSSAEYALIPIDDALILWADVIVFVNNENYMEACLNWQPQLDKGKTTIILNIVDSFGYDDAELVEQLKEQLNKSDFGVHI